MNTHFPNEQVTANPQFLPPPANRLTRARPNQPAIRSSGMGQTFGNIGRQKNERIKHMWAYMFQIYTAYTTDYTIYSISKYTFINLECTLHITGVCICNHWLRIYLPFFLSTHLSFFAWYWSQRHRHAKRRRSWSRNWQVLPHKRRPRGQSCAASTSCGAKSPCLPRYMAIWVMAPMEPLGFCQRK